MKKDKLYLHEMYNATSTDDGKGELESYENWLENNLLTRIDALEADKFVYILESKHVRKFRGKEVWLNKEFYDSNDSAKNHMDMLVEQHHYAKEDLRIVIHRVY